MGIGYVLGCLVSILAWRIDRQYLFSRLDRILDRFIGSKILMQIVYLMLTAAACLCIEQISIKEVNNFITALLVIDISNTEKKNLRQRDRVKFYDSISVISRALVCGFIAPLFFITFLGNTAGIAYMLIYNIGLLDEEIGVFRAVFTILTVVPAIAAEVFLYIIYFFRNRKSEIDFKGDYLPNTFLRPLLNVDILGAYIESVNFYYLYSARNTDYLKSYGEYSKKIDDVCVRDYLSICYGICLVIFVLFFSIVR